MLIFMEGLYPVSKYMFKVNKKGIRTTTIDVNLLSLLLTLNRYLLTVLSVDVVVMILLLNRDLFYPGNIYLFKVNNRNARKSCKICSKLTKKHQNDTKYVTPFSSVSIVDFE